MLLEMLSRGKTRKGSDFPYKVVSNRNLAASLGKTRLEARLLCDEFPGFRKHVKVVCERTHHS